MDDVEQVCERIVLSTRAARGEGKIEDLKAIDREYEVHVWGRPTPWSVAWSTEACVSDGEGGHARADRDDVPREVLEVAASTGPRFDAFTPTRLRSRTSSSPSWNGLATTSIQRRSARRRWPDE